MLYLGTNANLSLRAAPDLAVEEVETSREAVRQWFSLATVCFIGAHTGCSCGFPTSSRRSLSNTGTDLEEERGVVDDGEEPVVAADADAAEHPARRNPGDAVELLENEGEKGIGD
jgi:hypothetical protein